MFAGRREGKRACRILETGGSKGQQNHGTSTAAAGRILFKMYEICSC